MRQVLAALVIVAFSGSVWPAVAVTEEQQANGRPSNRGGLTFQSNNPSPLDDVRALERSGEGDNAEARQSWRRLLDGEREAADQSVATRRDSLLNGLLIGAAAGAALGLIPDYFDDCEECHDSLYASIAVGAGIGLLVDAFAPEPTDQAPTDRARSGGCRRSARRSQHSNGDPMEIGPAERGERHGSRSNRALSEALPAPGNQSIDFDR
jgi:hypothetical protein